ncbi:hypothetical protein ABI_40280 [Asticcacaulis biprosthecium C19]|uniref:Deacetylase PdaC domain-containing protein n=1 Tax=Asticcacaulis biprosthecium C19 TaxID=715226 RepID=F4QS91_9CAUL|nr:DUF4163 domain-containing protein [Asticcacaulis biprosthecium]EGF89611.1 hypothetical protein ABI_40280 [Asticcacaulis biprosthecium C19]
MMSVAKQRIWVTAAICLALFACQKKPEEQATSDKPPATVAPLGYAATDAGVQVTMTLPEPIKLYPELHTLLYNEGEGDLVTFMKTAAKDRAEQSADGFPVADYYRKIDWKIAAQSQKLVSLYSEMEDFQGGAHPGHDFQALLWDKSKSELIPTGKLFVNGADMTHIDAYACKQIEALRSKRAGEPVSQADFGGGCPKFASAKLILIPSTVSGKIGAVDALFAPSEVGAYAEGPYEIRVPQNVLKSALNPEFADQFAGDPVAENALPDPDADIAR